MEFDYWELGGDKGIETADGFNVNVMAVAAALDRSGGRRLPAGPPGLLGHRRHAAGDGPRRRTGGAARSGERVLAVDWGFSNTTLCVVGNDRPLYARRLHDCHFRNCLEAIQAALGVTLDHAQHLVDVHGVVAPGAEANWPTATEDSSSHHRRDRRTVSVACRTDSADAAVRRVATPPPASAARCG